MVFQKTGTITLAQATIVTFCCLSAVNAKGIFFHSTIIDGKPQVVATAVNGSLTPKMTKPTNQTEPKSAKFEIPLTIADQDWLSSLLYLPKDGEERLRKEYRELTSKERRDLNLAFNLLKNDTSVSLNKYDLLANIHARSSANANAHNGPNFLGWHRVFLLMMENALREKVPSATLPYWDVTLDEAMDRPYESIVWSDDFIGSGDGVLSRGAFGAWETQFGYGHLRRMLAAQGKLMSSEDVDNILSQRRLGDITSPGAEKENNIEQIHNDVHVWIGGQMKTIEIAAFDPIFYLLHAFTDHIWMRFRENQERDGIDPETDYPEFYGSSAHSPFAPMALGRVMVLDGISGVWNRNIKYTPRPFCNGTNDSCGSPYLKCDKTKGKCVSKSLSEVKKTQALGESIPELQRKEFSRTSLPKEYKEDNVLLYTKESVIENLYVTDIKVINKNQTGQMIYTQSKNRIGLTKVTSISELYQFYSSLSGHEDLTNIVMFLIYLQEYHFKNEYR